MLLMALFAPWAAAQNTVTVCDGTETNDYVPVYGYYLDSDQIWSEFILPSSTTGLSELTGKAISGMTFYLATPASDEWGCTFEVYMTETDSITQTTTWTGSGTTVYTGELDGRGTTMDITFDIPYVYHGGNLLIGTVTGNGSYDAASFYGVSAVSGASIYVYYYYGNYYGGPLEFLPKTTFTYSSYLPPYDFVVSNLTQTAATIGWTAPSTSVSRYQYQYKAEGGDWTALASTTSTSASLTGLTEGTQYTFRVQATYSDGESAFVDFTFKTPCYAFPIPYTYGFEDASEINCWTMVDCEEDVTYGLSGVINSTSYAHTDTMCYAFSSFNGTVGPPQYLISPELSGMVNGLHVEFWYRDYGNNETFKVGYSTTTMDVASFTWSEEYTCSETYTLFKGNYPAETKYVAVQYTSDYLYYMFLDDFSFTEASACVEPSSITAERVTTTGAFIGWTPLGSESYWDLYVTSDATDVPDDTTTPTVANTPNNPYELTGLTPATTYYVYLRAVCDVTEKSDWSTPKVFNTECDAMALPYTYGFEADALSVCWNVINDNPSYNTVSLSTSNPNTGSKNLDLRRGSPDGTQIVVLPEVDATYALNGYRISFYAKVYNQHSNYAGTLTIGVMTDPSDETTFVQVGDPIEPTTAYENYTVMLNTYTGTGNYIAFKHTSTAYGNTYLDDINITQIPSCLEPDNLAVDGGANAVVSWTGTAAEYDIAFADDSSEDPDKNIVGSTTGGAQNFNLGAAVTLTEGDYYVWVRANCGNDDYSTWVGPVSFHVGFCTPNPTSHDGSGITGVSFGTGSYVVTNGDGSASLPDSAPFYGDYTSMIGAVQAGIESPIAITTATTGYSDYPYTFVIWVDLDNSMSFEDSEILYIGKAPQGTGTFNANITIPATQTVGDYRMRIYGADSYFTSFYNNGNTNWSADHDPCSSGSYRHAHDYTLRVLEAPSCLPAGNVTVDPANITSTSAVISWTNNNGASATYTVMQGSTTLTTTAVDRYTLTGLTAATTYPAGTFTIISDCDATMIANVPEFTTECDDITTLPWSEDFEGFANNTVPMCWDNSASTSSTVTSSPYYIWGVVTVNGNNMMKMENYWAYSGTALINTPTIVMPATGTYQLSFDYAHNATCGEFQVNVSEDNGATWIELGSYAKGSGTSHTEPGDFTSDTISLASYAGKSIILQFFANANYGSGAIFVDNISIDPEPVTSVTQDIALSSGSNWVSFNVDITLDSLKAALVAALPGTQMVIKAKNNEQLTYTGSKWKGNLASLDVAQMYMIQVASASTISVVGMPLVPADHPVTIVPGANWIAFPFSTSMTPTEAFAGFALTGDVIKNKDNQTAAYNGTKWKGSLTTLEPGKGYIFTSSQTTDRTFIFPTGTTKK